MIYPSFQNPMGAAEAGNRIWLINPHGDTVKEVTLAGFPPVYLPLTTGSIGAGMGSVWLRALGTPVNRYDARTLRLLGTYPADPHAEGYQAAGFGSLWVANMDTCTLWRDRITG